jgi:hypothetical protein
MGEICVEWKTIKAKVPTILILLNLLGASRPQRLHSRNSTEGKKPIDIDDGT